MVDLALNTAKNHQKIKHKKPGNPAGINANLSPHENLDYIVFPNIDLKKICELHVKKQTDEVREQFIQALTQPKDIKDELA